MRKDLSVYIHIPFCASKCKYCDFHSITKFDEYIEPYFDALKKEIINKAKDFIHYQIKTIFIGGGTPSVVNSIKIFEIINILNKHYNLCNDAEISIEANPGTLSIPKLKMYKESGVNRLSLGLQSFDDSILNFIGRIHTKDDFLHSFYNARNIGFVNINVDLMFGIYNQTIESVKNDIKNIIDLDIQHVSAYSLKVEENTEFYRLLDTGVIKQVDDEIDRSMYWYIRDELIKNGYIHYEISNFSKLNFECIHNMQYWTLGEYIGFGSGAHSNIENKRFSNIKNISNYIKNVNNSLYNLDINENIVKNERISEYIILGLRLINGININEFNFKFNIDFIKYYSDTLSKLKNDGLINIEKSKISLTSKGLDFANRVFVEFI